MSDQQRQVLLYFMVDRVDALELTVRKLQAPVLNNSEIIAHKFVVSSNGVKDKEKPSEEKFGQQGEDLTSPSCVKAEGRIAFERPHPTLWELEQELMEQNYYERHEYRDEVGDITKKIHVEVPEFEERIDPQVFSNWLASLERSFDQYDMSDERKVRFAIMKLIRQAQIWWIGVEYDCRCVRQPQIVKWDDMKHKLKQKYLPCDYDDELFEQLTTLRQWNMSIVEYMNKFEELKIRCRGVEDPRQTLA